jgi:hypothetical protein
MFTKTPCRTLPAVLTLAGAVCLLAGCGNDLTRTFGFTRDAPDEFTVTTRAPLSMPPNFTVRPPLPGAPRPQEQTERVQAEQALVPQTALDSTAAPAGSSPGQEALLHELGTPASADIRQQIDQDSLLDHPSPSFTDKLMFWHDSNPPPALVDPKQEADRLRTNAALGQNPDTGTTPIIQTKPKSWWNRIF